jgi:hypothetical protein
MHAAIWADDIKGTVPGYTNDTDMSHPRARQNTGYSDRFQHRYWHYVDYPFSQDGTPLNQAQIPAINAEERMALFAKTLGSSASESVKSYDLVWLLHLVGDVHQPLHATARVSKALRRGDQGGNLHSVCYDKKLQNCQTLHSFWDGIVGDTHVAAEAAQFANMLNVPDPAEAANLDVSDWTSQSFELAKQQVYVAPIVVNGSKSLMNGEYRMNARNLSRDRMSLGGARLAALINANLK